MAENDRLGKRIIEAAPVAESGFGKVGAGVGHDLRAED
jgi:hypothetical protein